MKDGEDAAPTLAAIAVRLILAALGTTLAVGALEATALARSQPYALIPFVTSIALVIGLPGAAPSHPRALLGGHLVSTLVGYAVLHAAGSSPVAAAIGTGLSVGAMLATRTMHPPAAIDPFLVVNEALGPAFLLDTVLPGSVLLAAFAWGWTRLPAAATRLTRGRGRSRAGRTAGPARGRSRPGASGPRGTARDDGSGG